MEADGSFDFTVPPRIVPCDGLHAYEIADRVSLGDGAFPSEVTAGQLLVQIPALRSTRRSWAGHWSRPTCTPSQLWPDETEWAQGIHDVVCLVGGSEPFVGSARSGSLGGGRRDARPVSTSPRLPASCGWPTRAPVS